MVFKAGTLVGAMLIGSPAFSQGSLGITGATFGLASTEDEAGDLQSSLGSSVDVRITGVHGLQGELSFAETATGTIGKLTAHLYMAPHPDRKYGLVFSLSDVDGRSMAWGSAGAEAMISLNENTTFEGHLGLGAAQGSSLDFIFGGVSSAHSIGPEWVIEAALDVADVDEASFRATMIDASLKASFSPQGRPWSAFAGITHSELAGRDGDAAATRLGFGVTFAFGTTGGVDPATRMFRSPDPVAGLVRRGLW